LNFSSFHRGKIESKKALRDIFPAYGTLFFSLVKSLSEIDRINGANLIWDLRENLPLKAIKKN
jgi:hypothetical protein